MNIENMEKVIGQLERLDPRKFSMNFWLLHPNNPRVLEHSQETQQRVDECGTIGCIAGWVSALNGGPTEEAAQILDFAKDFLGLDYYEHRSLFYGSWCPNGIMAATTQEAVSEMRRMIAVERAAREQTAAELDNSVN